MLQAQGDFLVTLIFDCCVYCRFTDTEETEALDLQTALVDGVLVKLLWHDYIAGYQKTSLVTASTESSPVSGPGSLSKASGAPVAGVSSNRFQKELGSCIVQTLEHLSRRFDEIMETFWNDFHNLCFQIIVEVGNNCKVTKEEDPRIGTIAEFFLILGRSTKDEDRQWSLTKAVRPFVAKSFQRIRSLVSSLCQHWSCF
jgi:hypothetical protein